MNKNKIIAGALMVVALMLSVRAYRQASAARYVADIAYSLVCTNCRASYQWTTTDLNRMVRHGQWAASPGQNRRFHCPACQQTSVMLRQYLEHSNEKTAAIP